MLMWFGGGNCGTLCAILHEPCETKTTNLERYPTANPPRACNTQPTTAGLQKAKQNH